MLLNFETVSNIFDKYEIKLNKRQYDQLCIYADFLVEYNKNVNLTAITDPVEILYKHFIDSILLTKYVDFIKKSAIIDVGTGAGFPSVPIKIFYPDIKITLLDSLNKRITFLKVLCQKIEIDAKFIHGRAEIIGRMPEYREKFDISCARAVANMSLLSEYCLPFVKVGGIFTAMKGPSENINVSLNAVNLLGGEIENDFSYEIESEKRKIVVVRKVSQTSTSFPRNSSQIKKKPL